MSATPPRVLDLTASRRRLRDHRRRAVALAREAARLRGVPPRVVLFYLRAWLTARRSHDRFTLDSASRPSDVATLLRLARGHTSAVELGTGTAWTAIALALADARRRVASYDPVTRPERRRYLGLVGEPTRERIVFHEAAAEDASPVPASVGFLFIDCAHDRDTTAAAFRTWGQAVAPGGVVAFHDYDHPAYPGVRQAVDELSLTGSVIGGLFVWRKP